MKQKTDGICKIEYVVYVMFWVYVVAVLWLTLFSRIGTYERKFLYPFQSYVALAKGNASFLEENVENVLLFVPLGIFIGITKHKSLKEILVIGILVSLCIECAQMIFALGTFECDDLLHNTIGALIGYLLARKLASKFQIQMNFKRNRGRTMLRKWDDLPEFMKLDEVRPYYEILNKKRASLFFKRTFDLIVGFILLIVLAIPMVIIAIMIKTDSEGPVFYRQERVTKYGKHFRIHKFRTMVSNADQIGAAVTVGNDSRITKVGKRLRGCRLDELPQVFDLLSGNMSFVGTRPEAVKFVQAYKPEYMATLLMPAGITSEASIRYKDEDRLLSAADNVDKVYLEEVLPAKMIWNLESVRQFSFFREIFTMLRTVFAVLGKDYSGLATISNVDE